ncbi:thiolase family protein [Tyzzerella sp. OttesenSCG-928-J15]|nr:thiolase family protein [Tyzzerella sp. OttesenSCG-928-J15]
MNFNTTPYSKNSGVHINKVSRGVSIIGVGLTPFGSVLSTPELKDLSEKELAAWAAQLAMTDAGIKADVIETLCFSQAHSQSRYIQTGANMFMVDWLGMRAKPSNWHVEASASSYCAFNEAYMTIASGKHDIAIVCGSDTNLSYTSANTPPYIRYPIENFEPPKTEEGSDWFHSIQTDNAYTRWNGTYMAWMDESILLYMKKYGLSKEQMADVLDALAISMRHNSANNPLAMYQSELNDEAKQNNFSGAREYLRSEKNPYISTMHRDMHCLKHADGAGALILCASDIASKYHQNPVEILGIGISSMDSRYPRFITRTREEAYRQVFQSTGISPEEIDLMYSTDFTLGQILHDSEIVGYVPEGEAWRYALDGEFAFDGCKPFNTHGGSTGFAHASGVQLFTQAVEAVRQMRGECGKRQVKVMPKTVLISGQGDTQEGAAIVLRAQ